MVLYENGRLASCPMSLPGGVCLPDANNWIFRRSFAASRWHAQCSTCAWMYLVQSSVWKLDATSRRVHGPTGPCPAESCDCGSARLPFCLFSRRLAHAARHRPNVALMVAAALNACGNTSVLSPRMAVTMAVQSAWQLRETLTLSWQRGQHSLHAIRFHCIVARVAHSTQHSLVVLGQELLGTRANKGQADTLK
jgi:hypothetical protein